MCPGANLSGAISRHSQLGVRVASHQLGVWIRISQLGVWVHINWECEFFYTHWECVFRYTRKHIWTHCCRGQPEHSSHTAHIDGATASIIIAAAAAAACVLPLLLPCMHGLVQLLEEGQACHAIHNGTDQAILCVHTQRACVAS